MINPSLIFKLKSQKEIFTKEHPKFFPFLQAAKNLAAQEGSVIEIKVTNPEGKNLETNLKIKSSDLELIQMLNGIIADNKK